MKLAVYIELRQAVIVAGYQKEYEWAQNIKRPSEPLDLFCEYTWIVINSGMKAQVASIIWDKIEKAIGRGDAISSAFKHPGKSAAIQKAWNERREIFKRFNEAEDILKFCESLPWIGKITKYHLAKNLGAQYAKPDRWLSRVAKETGETVQNMCERLASESGDKITTVDSMIWRACNLGLWKESIRAEKEM